MIQYILKELIKSIWALLTFLSEVIGILTYIFPQFTEPLSFNDFFWDNRWFWLIVGGVILLIFTLNRIQKYKAKKPTENLTMSINATHSGSGNIQQAKTINNNYFAQVPEIIDEVSEKNTRESNETFQENCPTEEVTEKSEGISCPEYGVGISQAGQSTIYTTSPIFFENRISDAFPGIRGLHWFKKRREISQLEILLREPVVFDNIDGDAISNHPIWWYRGMLSSAVQKFGKIGFRKWLLNYDELRIRRIAVFHSPAYWQSYIYIETMKDRPIGLYKYNHNQLSTMVEPFGFASEEFALFNGKPISRQCYDDGRIIVDGESVSTSESELRARYLSPYNVLISSEISPIGSPQHEVRFGELLNEVLKDKSKFSELHQFILRLNRYDYLHISNPRNNLANN